MKSQQLLVEQKTKQNKTKTNSFLSKPHQRKSHLDGFFTPRMVCHFFCAIADPLEINLNFLIGLGTTSPPINFVVHPHIYLKSGRMFVM